jgi:hypothetical protein
MRYLSYGLSYGPQAATVSAKTRINGLFMVVPQAGGS